MSVVTNQASLRVTNKLFHSLGIDCIAYQLAVASNDFTIRSTSDYELFTIDSAGNFYARAYVYKVGE
jgi:hypothetical protein